MRFNRLLIASGALAGLVIAAGALFLRFSPEVKLNFTQAEIQKRLDPAFPAKKCLLACIELANPRIGLPEGADVLVIEADFVATLGNRNMPGKAKLTGRPYYDPSKGNFYLQNVTVTEFSMTGNAPDFNDVVKVRGPGVMAAILEIIPLYSLASHPQYGTIAKLALRSIRVANGRVEVVFVNPLLLFGSSPQK